MRSRIAELEADNAHLLGMLKISEQVSKRPGAAPTVMFEAAPGTVTAESGGTGQGDGVQPAELDLDPPPGQAGAAFGDADEQQRQPAQQHVRPDPRLDAVEHRL